MAAQNKSGEPKTLAKAWERHFKDSLQLINYIPDSPQTLFDIGSGAGFPGLVLAIVRPDLDVHLVESDEKNALFWGRFHVKQGQKLPSIICG